jgi:hypothetical protein
MAGLLGGLDDPTQPVAPGMGASQYVANPNFTASLAPPQMVANPRPGYGNWMPGQPAPQPAAGAGTAPTGGMNLTNDDVQKALGMLYSQIGVSPEQARAYSGQAGLLGNAAQGQGGTAAQQPGANANALANAFQGFQDYQGIKKQLDDFKAATGGDNWHGREGGGIV